MDLSTGKAKYAACDVGLFMRLKYLSLNKIIDVAYMCGIDDTPVSVFIAAPSGAGKTFSARSVMDTDFVQYISDVYSPNEHRHVIVDKAPRTRLFINDDLGKTARWNQKEYFSTFMAVADGELSYTQWHQHQFARTVCSMVLLATTDYYTINKRDMAAMGLLDRVVPVVVGLSQETRHEYQDRIRQHLNTREPPRRDPHLYDKGEYKDDLIERKDINPRLLQNLSYMSQYMTDEEFVELIAVAHEEDKYEV
jgi:hypothetical protein